MTNEERIKKIREEYEDLMTNSPDKTELFDLYHENFEFLLEIAEK